MEKITHKSRSSTEDLTGQTFGRLTAIRPASALEGTGGRKRWLCRCSCGNECVVLASNLVRGHTESCGCLKQRDLTGQHINMLTVLERSDKFGPRGKRKVPLWKCRCDCGNITYKATDTLTSSQECSCAECAGKRNASKARENAGFEDGTQLCKIMYNGPSMPHDGKCKGVYFDKKHQLYEAAIKFRGKRTRLGYFRKFEDAVKARQVAEDEVFGEFLRQRQAKEDAQRVASLSDSTEKADGDIDVAAVYEKR